MNDYENRLVSYVDDPSNSYPIVSDCPMNDDMSDLDLNLRGIFEALDYVADTLRMPDWFIADMNPDNLSGSGRQSGHRVRNPDNSMDRFIYSGHNWRTFGF